MIKAFLVLLLAVLPVVILGYYVYYKDKDKEPKKLLFELFLGGLLAAVLTVLISLIIRKIFPFFDGNTASYKPIQLLVYTMFIVSLVEEVSKFIITYLISYHNKEYDQLYDMIVYAVFVSLGFAWIENVLYIIDGGISAAVSRFLFAVPTHASVAVFMGYYLSLSKLADINKKEKLKFRYLILSILIPTLFHGLYDFLVYSSSYFLMYLLSAFSLLLFIKANEKLVQVSSSNINFNK